MGKPTSPRPSSGPSPSRSRPQAGPWLDLIRCRPPTASRREASATVERARGLIKADDPGVLEARLRWAAGDRAAADRAFQAAIAGRPDDAHLRILASRFYEETGRPAEAGGLPQVRFKDRAGEPGAARQLALLISLGPRDLGEGAGADRRGGPGRGDAPKTGWPGPWSSRTAPDPARRGRADRPAPRPRRRPAGREPHRDRRPERGWPRCSWRPDQAERAAEVACRRCGVGHRPPGHRRSTSRP